jgi:hypothetical protein
MFKGMETKLSPEPDAGVVGVAPDAALAAVQDGFFEHLRALAPPALREPETAPARIRSAIARLEAQTAHLVASDLDRCNVGFVLLAVAGYDLLLPELGHDQALGVVDACLNQPLRRWVLEGTRALLDRSPDPFADLVATSRAREATYFGPSFTFEHPIDDSHGYLLHVRRCLFHETLRVCQRTELQPLICRFDLNWIDAIDPDRHHVRFVRPSTFATADLCRMWLMRVEQVEAPAAAPAPLDGP